MTPHFLPYSEVIRDINGVRLQMGIVGQERRPLVILLHGFPDVWQGWHLQIPMLETAGYRVIAPNQRGYGKSDKPKEISAYDLDFLARDIIGIADSERAQTFSVVGHDWGGVVAWWLAASYPHRISHLGILNAPHPGVFHRYMLHNPVQILRSWYIGFFQLPWLPEVILSSRHFELLFQCVKRTSRTGTFDESDRRYLVADWSERGSITGMLNYYRALARRPSRSFQKRISVPTVILWGKRDPSLAPGLATASLAECDRGSLTWLETARHWIQREETSEVHDCLCQFLSTRG